MNSLKLLCFISAILINLSFNSAQTNDYVYHFCGNTGNFTDGSTYAQNLNTLLSSLSSSVMQTDGFKNITIGRDPDRIYGFFLCRGDVSIQFCQTCVDAARNAVLQRCPAQKESIMHYEKCMLRYSNQSLFGILETSPAVFLTNTQNITERDRDGFNRLLGNLFVGLEREASRVPSGPKFSTGSVNFTTFQTIYALMQCTPDLSQSDCFRCLDGAKAYLPSCCNGKIGARVILPSCNLRYEVSSFVSPFQDQTKEYLYYRCGKTGTFSDSSAYATNLKQLLSSLSSNVPSSNGYRNDTVGLDPDRIYGAIMCRGDIETQLCKLCVDSAMTTLPQLCPQQKESLIWYEYCMLRYSNQLFFSVVQTSSPVPLLNAQNASDPEGFYQVLGELMTSLTNDATGRFPGRLFAAKERNFSGNQIYGLVQCTPDLSSSDCSFCLGVLVGQLPTCCRRPTGGSVILPSCYLKYDIRPFYESRTVALYPPPIFPVLPPPPSLTNSTPPQKVPVARVRLARL